MTLQILILSTTKNTFARTSSRFHFYIFSGKHDSAKVKNYAKIMQRLTVKKDGNLFFKSYSFHFSLRFKICNSLLLLLLLFLIVFLTLKYDTVSAPLLLAFPLCKGYSMASFLQNFNKQRDEMCRVFKSAPEEIYLIKRKSIYECDKSKRKSIRRARFISPSTLSTFQASYLI